MIIFEIYNFTEEQRKKIEKYLPKRKSGSTWRAIPERLGKWQSVHRCFSRWSKEGIFENIFSETSKVADTSEISGINLKNVKVLADRGYSTKVERLFLSWKNNRRLATRYDKLDNNFLSFIYFYSIFFRLK